MLCSITWVEISSFFQFQFPMWIILDSWFLICSICYVPWKDKALYLFWRFWLIFTPVHIQFKFQILDSRFKFISDLEMTTRIFGTLFILPWSWLKTQNSRDIQNKNKFKFQFKVVQLDKIRPIWIRFLICYLCCYSWLLISFHLYNK